MEPRDIARFLAAGRIAFGFGFGLIPERTAPLWLGGIARTPGAIFFCRILGARDFVLGAGAMAALSGRGDPRPWILAGATADAADLAATVAAREELPPTGYAVAVATTVGAVALGVLAYRGQS